MEYTCSEGDLQSRQESSSSESSKSLRKRMSMHVNMNGQKAGSDNCQEDMHFEVQSFRFFAKFQ